MQIFHKNVSESVAKMFYNGINIGEVSQESIVSLRVCGQWIAVAVLYLRE